MPFLEKDTFKKLRQLDEIKILKHEIEILELRLKQKKKQLFQLEHKGEWF